MPRSVRALLIAAGLSLVAFVGLLLIMRLLATPPAKPIATPTHSLQAASPSPTIIVPTPTVPVRPTPTPAVGEVADLSEVVVPRQVLETTHAVDTFMNDLAGQPTPSLSQTLELVVAEELLLRAADMVNREVDSETISARITGLSGQWNMSANDLATALEEGGLSPAVLEERVTHLILVEQAMAVLSQEYPDLDAWLVELRQDVDVRLEPPTAVTPVIVTEEATGPEAQATPVAALFVSPLEDVLEPAPAPVPQVQATEPNQAAGDLEGGALPALAPDFSLHGANGESVTLSSYRGQSRVVLVFHRGQT